MLCQLTGIIKLRRQVLSIQLQLRSRQQGHLSSVRHLLFTDRSSRLLQGLCRDDQGRSLRAARAEMVRLLRIAPFRSALIVLIALVAALVLLARQTAFPLGGDQTVLPTGTEFSEEALAKPRELFHSEAVGGHKSYLINLGDLAFNSPTILGGKARQAEMSCATCHVNGTSNPKLFVPGASSRPGTFDTTSLMFNPKAFNSILDPVRIPSLRGAPLSGALRA